MDLDAMLGQLIGLTKTKIEIDIEKNKLSNNKLKDDSNVEKTQIEVQIDRYKKHTETQIKDYDESLDSRKFLIKFTVWFLAVQNIVIFVFIYLAYFCKFSETKDFSIIVTTLVTATILETGILMRSIYSLIFSKIEYLNIINNKNGNP